MPINYEAAKTLIKGLVQKMKSFRGNWEQNDPTADDYIKNRPFYTEDPKSGIVHQLDKKYVPPLNYLPTDRRVKLIYNQQEMAVNNIYDSLSDNFANRWHEHYAWEITSGILPTNIGGTGYSSITDTTYTTARYRASSLHSSETNPTTNGTICWTYE